VVEAETMTRGGFGVSEDASLTDDTGSSVKMEYSASGEGSITHSLNPALQRPGIWQARPRLKVDAVAGVSDLVEIGVYNLATAAWAKTTPSGATDAVIILKASELAAAFVEKIVQFAWNGQDQLELRIRRLVSDNATVLWLDKLVLRSAFSKDTGDGKAPVGALVTVESAAGITVDVSASLTVGMGYDAATVKTAAAEAVSAYIRSLAYLQDNDPRWVRIAQAILDTPGVVDFTNLLVNGGTGNIAVGEQELAIPGVITLS
jgi:hypothetical protein